jgi:hypothetical protein
MWQASAAAAFSDAAEWGYVVCGTNQTGRCWWVALARQLVAHPLSTSSKVRFGKRGDTLKAPAILVGVANSIGYSSSHLPYFI